MSSHSFGQKTYMIINIFRFDYCHNNLPSLQIFVKLEKYVLSNTYYYYSGTYVLGSGDTAVKKNRQNSVL